MPGILSVNRHVDDGSHAVTTDVRNTQTIHQLIIAGRHGVVVHHGGDSFAADFLDLGYPAAVDFLAIGTLQALADGMAGG